MPHKSEDVSRRDFLSRAGRVAAGVSFLNVSVVALSGCTTESATLADALDPRVSDTEPSWHTVITTKDEPGRPLIVTGRIFGADGRKPLRGAILVAYHTDNRGLYTGGPANQPARLRGLMKTDIDGRYEFRTIKPVSYPGTSNPEHIHASVAGSGYTERWIDNFLFDDDPLITREMRSQFSGLGSFSPLMMVKKGDDGIFRCTRDIRVERV